MPTYKHLKYIVGIHVGRPQSERILIDVLYLIHECDRLIDNIPALYLILNCNGKLSITVCRAFWLAHQELIWHC